MEKDFNEEIPILEETTEENTEHREYSTFNLEANILKQKLLKLELARKRQEIARIEHLFRAINFYPFQNLHLEPAESRIVSPISEAQNLSQDEFKNLPDPITLHETLLQNEITFHDPVEYLRKQYNEHYNNIVSNESLVEGQVKKFPSATKTSENESLAAQSYSDSDTKFKTEPDCKLMETDEESDKEYVGKGKEARNPKYRYKKISKSDVSCRESLTMDTPVKGSEEGPVPPESKTLDSQSSKFENTGVFLTGKRRESDCTEKDRKRKSDENCARTSGFRKSSGNRLEDDGDLKIVKKPKFRYEKLSRLNSNPTEPSKNFKSIDSEEFMEQTQTDHSLNESSQAILPSSKVASKSEDLFLKSESKDVLLSESEESSLTRILSNVSLCEREDSSLV